MASTGPALYPGASTFPGAAVFPGQGTLPLLLVQYSTDDVSTLVPAWLDATASVRQFSTTRGRESELDDMQAGTASLVLDNRARTFDPVSNAAIRPLNRWWIREQFTGETQDLFVGYAEAYEQSWPSMVNDAITTVSCADEFKVLSLGALPTMSPPRDTYSDLITGDQPNGYWHMDDYSGSLIATAAIGDNLFFQGGGIGSDIAGALVGANPNPYECMLMVSVGGSMKTNGMSQGGSADLSGCTEFAVEFWFKAGSVSGASDNMMIGPSVTGPNVQWSFTITGGVITFTAWNGTSNFTCTSTTITDHVWYHIVAVAEGTAVKFYVNGSLVSTAAGTWTSVPVGFIASEFTLGEAPAGLANNQYYDEIAIYRNKLTATQVLNHYNAGVHCGAVSGQTADQRMNQVLDTVGSHAARSIRTGTRTMTGVFFTGQPPLDELRNARDAENVDAMFYTSRSGVLTFLDAAHRSSSPWNTVQSTWGDAGGSEIPYQDLTIDFSEQFLANEWNVTADGGLVQTASDSTSISRYYKRSQQLSVPVSSDAQAATIAAAMLAKYKDPFTRITGITALASTPAVSEALFRRDLGDCIRILRTPPGGGSRIDQTSFIQKIAINGSPASPWSVTWTVSPL